MIPTILIVEDEGTIAYTLEKLLSADGFSVQVALDGLEGWKLYQELQPDIVVSDIKMPKMDGVALLEKIKQDNPKTDVILLTGHGDLVSAKRAVELGAYSYLEKPIFDIIELSGLLRKALEKRRLVQDRELVDRISRDLSRRLNFSDFLDRFLEHMIDAFEQIDLAIISMHNVELDSLTILGARGTPDCSSLVGMQTVNDWSVGAQAFIKQGPVRLDNRKFEITDLPESIPPLLAELSHTYPALGVMGIPIIIKDKAIGSLTVVNLTSIDELDDHLTELLSTLCRQIGLYLENARLFENLQAQTGRLRAVVDNSMDGIILVDPDGKPLMSNYRFHTMFSEGAQSPSYQQFLTILQNSLEEAEHTSFTITLEHPTSFNPTVLEVYATHVRQSGESVGIVANLRDVTFLRSMDRNRTLILDIARHEIGTPLDSIAFHAELINKHWETLAVEQRKETLDWMASHTRDIKKMISETLSYSEIKEELLTKEQKSLNLSLLAEELSREIRILTDKKHQNFSSQIEPDLWVIGNLTLKQAFRNLLENARRFTQEGGNITWRVYRRNHRIVATVEDNGPGIPDDELDRIFEPYYRASTTSDPAGTGLGLSIVNEVIAAHRGSIQVESDEGKGSCFTVTLMATNPG
ncbi:MAG: response regulator [Anaerolineales bacterium]|nr:response regulator [Anaerolineales bacterium]